MISDSLRAMGSALKAMSHDMNRTYRQRREIYLDGIEPTIERLEEALANLQDAVSAVDMLKDQARRAAEDVEMLQADRDEKQAAYESAMADLDETNGLLKRDRKKLQVALGINPWRERLWGFAIGVVASLVASKAYDWLK